MNQSVFELIRRTREFGKCAILKESNFVFAVTEFFLKIQFEVADEFGIHITGWQIDKTISTK